MTARILIVDDIEINIRLLEARLHAEYFSVLTATNGPDALAVCEREAIDLVLLDVMMPGMDGYEVARRLKANARTRHIPIVLITALDGAADRIAGLEAGADDFLTKPVRDLQLFSRVRSLTRLKLLTDELRVRAETTLSLLGEGDILAAIGQGGSSGRIAIYSEGAGERMARVLSPEHECHTAAPEAEPDGRADLFIVDLDLADADPLRLCSRIRSGTATRQTPVLLVGQTVDEVRIAKALDIGANDYLLKPIDRNELLARVRTQIKRKRYDENLRRSLRETIELAAVDALTGLQNRRFLQSHLPGAVERAAAEGKPLALIVADIDHFKRINDSFGHDTGDEVLREFAERLRDGLRASDLACRFGGEEFVIVMPDTDEPAATAIADRLRRGVGEAAFTVDDRALDVTVSMGLATLRPGEDTAASLLKRADRSLYEAKREGRNRVVALAA